MSEFRVYHWDESVDAESRGMQLYNYKFSPGTNFPVHTHQENKMDCIVSGQLSFTMFGKEIILGPGDRLEVPRNVPHSAHVVGKNQSYLLMPPYHLECSYQDYSI
ncbi:unnamed protein product [Heterobilharzia americana]|nr:unnamed protein product [Heterobilharzia americana]